MHDDKLPLGPIGDDARLPIRRDSGLPTAQRPGVLSVEMLAGQGGENPDEIDLMAYWRILLFATMFRNATSITAFFRIPSNRVVELGSQVVM